MKLFWADKDTPDELKPGLRELEAEYEVSNKASPGRVEVRFHRSEEEARLDVKPEGHGIDVIYDTPTRAYRAVGRLLSMDRPEAFQETAPFSTFGIMLDCSRNAVARVDALRGWMRKLALLGYDMVMLYMEDTYEVPGEPFFGYLRGRYTQGELGEIGQYGAKMGIEVIPCIQTLGHLGQLLRRPPYRDLSDTGSILLAGHEKTYDLIRKMIRAASAPFATRRIHIGMDEAHSLGRGRYLDLFGYRRNFDIFNEHLSRVVEICRELGLEPMIWSDMYFRMGSKTGDYYDTDSVIPDDVVKAVPRGVKLVYWDYYHDNKEFYVEWIRRHRSLAGEPVVASGIWTWQKLWYDHLTTVKNASPCIEACKEEAVRDFFFTLWMDDGAECDIRSAFCGLTWASELAYRGKDDQSSAARIFHTVCGGDYDSHILASQIEHPPKAGRHSGMARGFLWDDPLLGLFMRRFESADEPSLEELSNDYFQLARRLYDSPRGWDAGSIDHVALAAETIGLKIRLRKELVEAYGHGDRKRLAQIAETLLPELKEKVKALWSSHRDLWLSHNKAFGFEVLTIRYGGLLLRLEEIGSRIEEYVAGRISAIDELSEPAPALPHVSAYRGVATSSSIL